MIAVLLLAVLLAPLSQSEPMFEGILSMTPAQYSGAYEAAYSMLGWTDQLTMSNTKRARRMNKLQEPIPKSVSFPCDVSWTRSAVRPISVHALRPGDIDVIGAMGDSVTAAFGGTATDVMHAVIANRGISWSAGGLGTWREYLTLPNILKEFNPNLIGYSLGDSLGWHKRAQFNTAEGWAFSSDMLHQAQLLVKRMRTDARVDLDNHWKIVTMLFGSNDFCYSLCQSNLTHFELLENHRRDLTLVLDFLRDNLPRTLVNLVMAPSMMKMQQVTYKPVLCRMTNSFQCPCVLGLSYQESRNTFEEVVTAWQRMEGEVGNSARYGGKEDFAVVVQPFLKDMPVMKKETEIGEVPDFSYYSADCMHYSQKGNAMLANGLWNNMMEPVGHKSRRGTTELLKPFYCPTANHPFIYTSRNSFVHPFINYDVISPRVNDRDLFNNVDTSRDTNIYTNDVIDTKNIDTGFNNDVITSKDSNIYSYDVINAKNIDGDVIFGQNRRSSLGEDVVGTNSQLQYDRDVAVVRRVNDRALDHTRAESSVQSISLRRPLVRDAAGNAEDSNTAKHSFMAVRADGSAIRVSVVPIAEAEGFVEGRETGGRVENDRTNKGVVNISNTTPVKSNYPYGKSVEGTSSYNNVRQRSVEIIDTGIMAKDTDDEYAMRMMPQSKVNNSKHDDPKGKNVNVSINANSDFENTFFGIARNTLRTGGQIFRQFIQRFFT